MNKVAIFPLRRMLKKIGNRWRELLRITLTGLILLQFVVWFDTYWLPETTWLVTAAMAVTLFVEILFSRFHWSIRRTAALLLILLIHIIKLDIKFVASDTVLFGGKLGKFGDGMYAVMYAAMHALTQTSPYIWFALVTWLVYIFSIIWMIERARIMVYVVLSVIIFAVVDSYSLFVFWDQVAFIVFSGLGLIIVEHFEHFKRKHPDSWEYLRDYPWTIAAPAVIIISVVMLLGMLAPNSRPLLTDPYTAFMHMKGEEVVTSGKGFPPSVSGSNLNNSSGYGRDDSSLGGGFDYDFTEVMRVFADQNSYWRGETKSLYTGEGWLWSASDKSPSTSSVSLQKELESFDWGTESIRKTVEVRQTFYMSGEKSYPVLFGAYSIRSLELLGYGQNNESLANNLQWSSNQGELLWDEEEPYPDMYTAISDVPLIDEIALRQVSVQRYEGRPWEDYLQLPEGMPSRIAQLAENITRDAQTPYDKVKQIEAYLQENFKYNNQPDLSKGQSNDFVDRFLFEIQEGYCDYFSTAMAVMVRSIGLPSRWVKGYSSGSLDVEEFNGSAVNIPQSGEGGTFIVRNSDAHSWVEVYFDGWGWIPFEPTSGFILPTVADREQEQVEVLDISAEQAEADNKAASENWFLSPLVIVIAAASLAALAAVVLTGLRYGWWNNLKLLLLRRRELSLNQQVQQEIGKIFSLFRRKGYARSVHETARESFSRWIGQNRWLKKDLDQVLITLEKAKYSQFNVTGDDLIFIRQTKRRLKEELK